LPLKTDDSKLVKWLVKWQVRHVGTHQQYDRALVRPQDKPCKQKKSVKQSSIAGRWKKTRENIIDVYMSFTWENGRLERRTVFFLGHKSAKTPQKRLDWSMRVTHHTRSSKNKKTAEKT